MIRLFVLLTACRPDLTGYPHRAPEGATFYGVSTLLFDDGETALLTDGFFTRPGLLRVALPVRSDPTTFPALPKHLAAVIALHHHFDHAMDSAAVAKLTGAELLASPYLGGRTPAATETYGRYTLTFIESVHVASDAFPGVLEHRLGEREWINAYRTDKCYSLHIEHDGQTALVQGSAGFIKGKLTKRADVVYLGIGLLSKQSADYRRDYWEETVKATHAKRVFLIHWDDFFQREIVPMRVIADDVKPVIDELMAWGSAEGVDVLLADAVGR